MLGGWLIIIAPFCWLARKEAQEERIKREKFLAFLRRFREGIENQKNNK
jgi:hypothetical protein